MVHYLSALSLLLGSCVSAQLINIQDSVSGVQLLAPASVEPNWPAFLVAQSTNSQLSNFAWTFFRLNLQGTAWERVPSENCITALGNVHSPPAQPCPGQTVAKTFTEPGRYVVQLQFLDQDESQWYIMNSTLVVQNLRFSPVQRTEIRQLSMEDWQAIQQAFWRVKQLGIYDLMTSIHVTSMSMLYLPEQIQINVSHGAPAFLPWHRLFIRILEIAMQTFSENYGLAMPYWDWTVDAELPNGPTSSVIWTDLYLGAVDADGNVTTGPFCSVRSPTCPSPRWILPTYLSGPTLSRSLGVLSDILPTKNDVQTIMQEIVYDAPPYSNVSSGFRNALEGWLGTGHNAVHSFVGGHMAFPSSSNDPAFWVHHTFCDKIWHDWQVSRNCFAGCYQPGDGPDAIPSRAAVPTAILDSDNVLKFVGQQWSDKLWPWELSIKDVSDEQNSVRGYSYV